MNKQSTKTIELVKLHEHAGRVYPSGSELTLPKSKADWLIGTKVAKEVVAAAADVGSEPAIEGPGA